MGWHARVLQHIDGRNWHEMGANTTKCVTVAHLTA